jgi:general secretion pathway protein L
MQGSCTIMLHPTCFLFLDSLDPLKFTSLRLDENNDITAEPLSRNTEELLEIQKHAKTVVILPSYLGNILELELPWINEAKARLAIPFALEEDLASSIQDLHFAFDKNYYQDGKYLVIVVPQNILDNILNFFKTTQIAIDAISLDFFALNENSSMRLQDYIIVNHNDFKAALKEPFDKPYLKANPTIKIEKMHNITRVAQNIQHNSYINLLQGNYKKKNGSSILRNFSIIALIIWIISLALSSGIILYKLNAKIAQYDDIINSKYLEIFPDAKTIVAPQIRIRQALSPRNQFKQSNFWHLLHMTLLAMPSKDIQIKQIQFQQNVMTLNINCKSFALLASYVQYLQKRQIKVKQTQAKMHQSEVIATLELQ